MLIFGFVLGVAVGVGIMVSFSRDHYTLSIPKGFKNE
jgi:hypothetical protein